MNEKPDMMINIYGGNNLIAPVASSAIQNFYGDRGDEAADQPEDSEKTESTESVTDEKPAQEPAELSDDEFYVSVYIPDIKVMRAYKILLGECTTARELAVVVGKMLADENCRNVDKHTVVKAAFITVCGCGETASSASLQVSGPFSPRPPLPDGRRFPGNFCLFLWSGHVRTVCLLHRGGTFRICGRCGGTGCVLLLRNCWLWQRPAAYIPDRWGPH